ncbi:MAG: hypothetical protein IPI12_15775 [Ignavibacteriales bacterium]|nr:hypothetical protein [Ignavibacteriales bacterium]
MEGVLIPQQIDVQSPKLKEALKIVYESITVNKDLIIEFAPPADATVIEY